MKESKSGLNNKSASSKSIDYVAIFSNNYGIFRRIGYVLAGAFIVWSVKPWAVHVDIYFRGGKWGMPVRWGLAGVGLFFVFLGLLCKFPKRYHEEGLICPKCLTPYGLGRAPKSGKCKDCDVELEPIDGFYDRHPELRDKKDEVPEDLMDDLK